MPRIFVAIPLSPDAAAALERALPDLPALRRVSPDLMHVTLAFVGQVADDRVPAIADATTVAAASHGPFDLALDRIGRFPGHGPPRTIWAGMGPAAADAVIRLGASVRAELLRHRVQFDAKPLRAHVTLARVRDGTSTDEARVVAAAVNAARLPHALTFRAASVHVMESVLSSKGPRYSSRGEIPLAGPPGAIAGG